ncbi:MAG: hypothetical protein GY803_10335 [Chloroflexi bacterium]|nr:hypothetical protein [Chloroflexota bacterium]
MYTNILFYASTVGALILILVSLANPHKVQWRAKRTLNSIMSQEAQDELRQLTQNWGGQWRISATQLRLLSIGGGLLGALLGVFLFKLLGEMGLVLGAGLILVGYAYPTRRYKHGFSRAMLDNLEREAPLLAGYMYRAKGVAGMSVQAGFEQFIASYPNTQTTRLIDDIPPSASFVDALLGLGLPADEVGNWLEVINTLSTINEIADQANTLKTLRDRLQTREYQRLRGIIKKKSNRAVIITVGLTLPGLFAVLLGAIVLQAVRSLSGSSLF